MTPEPTLPRVTDILKDAGLIDTRWFTEEVRDRGTAVHAACHYLDEGDLDESSVDPAIQGYMDAYTAYRRDKSGVEWDWIECPRQDSAGRYRGTSDRVLCLRPRQLLDIKTGCHFAWHALQLAAYVNMMEDPYSYSRIGLYLQKEGRYQIRQYPKADYARDLSVFMAALTIKEWRTHYGK